MQINANMTWRRGHLGLRGGTTVLQNSTFKWGEKDGLGKEQNCDQLPYRN